MKFRVRSSAKVNLSLDILSRRPDGYHELASVVHTIGIWDEIEGAIGPPATGVSFECDVPELSGEDNLCVRAVTAFQAATNLDFGIALRLHKVIPTGAGLGGGSGNAAAVLLALNRAFDAPLDDAALVQIGAKVGADVPLFLRGGAMLMEGIGEKLTPLRPLEGCLLVVKSRESLSTPAVYRAWDEGGFESAHATERLLPFWLNTEKHDTLSQVGAALGNDLERATACLTSVPARLVESLQGCNSLGALMSGSGSACFGVFATETEAFAAQERFFALLAKEVLLFELATFVAPFVREGVVVVME